MTTPLTLSTARRGDGTPVLIAVGEIDMSNVDVFASALREAVGAVAEDFKVKRSRVYDLGLALERKGRGAP